MGFKKITTSLLKCAQTNDVNRARHLLVGIDTKDRKSIVAKRDNCNGPLFIAARRGNLEMVEFLVNECRADTEEVGRYEDPRYNLDHLVTPLWCAASLNRLTVVKLLIDLGADINAVSNIGHTPVLYACMLMNPEIVKLLVMHGADSRKPTTDGTTCLMIAAQESKEICQILIDNGAEVNAQDSSGYTALHWAITFNNHPDIVVQFLLDHGSDPYVTNEDGDDAFQAASLTGSESTLKQLLLKFKPSMRRKIQSYELLGVKYVNSRMEDIQKALHCWKKALKMRKTKSSDDIDTWQPDPVYLFIQKVNTVEELETLSQNRDFLYMYALMIHERILGPDHVRVQDGLLFRSDRFKEEGVFRRSIDLLKYAFRLQNDRAEIRSSRHNDRIIRYIAPLYRLCSFFCEVFRDSRQSNSKYNFIIEFEEVVEVLKMVTLKLEDAADILLSQKKEVMYSQLTFMNSILQLMKLIIELDKNENQQLIFRRIVYRLVRCQPKTHDGQTLLHLSVQQSLSEIDEDSFSQIPSIAVVELLLECGADVNAVDDEHSTVLHLCSKAIGDLGIGSQDTLQRIVKLLLKNDAHLDMVNKSGDTAARGLTSSLIEMDMYNCVSLKCAAVSTVMKYEIPYVGGIAASLESFLQMHGK